MLKKMLTLLLLFNFLFVPLEAENSDKIPVVTETAVNTIEAKAALNTVEVNPKVKRIFLQVGAIEKKEGNKILLRKKSSKLEFYLNNDVQIYKKEKASYKNIEPGNYIEVKGPKNKKTILANAVYIYKNKEEYDMYQSVGINRNDTRIDSVLLTGTVIDSNEMFEKINEGLRPILIESENGERFLVSYDDDTYWIKNEKANRSDIGTGDRVKLYFDSRITIRYKSYPIKIVISKVKTGF